MRIMYVEDNAVNLSLVRRIAQMGNHEVLSCTNGPDALRELENQQVDLILMDIELEGPLDGVEVVRRLRSRGDKRPIVALTAYAMVGDQERILEAGCDDYLPKPLPINRFLTLLAKYDPQNAKPETKEISVATPEAETLGRKKTTTQEIPTVATADAVDTPKAAEPETAAPPEVKHDETTATVTVTDTSDGKIEENKLDSSPEGKVAAVLSPSISPDNVLE